MVILFSMFLGESYDNGGGSDNDTCGETTTMTNHQPFRTIRW